MSACETMRLEIVSGCGYLQRRLLTPCVCFRIQDAGWRERGCGICLLSPSPGHTGDGCPLWRQIVDLYDPCAQLLDKRQKMIIAPHSEITSLIAATK